jgi:hypothetical protein
MTIYSASGYAFYMGFTDGVPYGNPLGLGISPQSPTAGVLFTGSNKIMVGRNAPSYPAMLAANWNVFLASPGGPTPLVDAGFTKVKISSPALSETAFPLATYSNYSHSMSFPAPTWVTTGYSPANPTGGAFTIKFIK